MADDDADVYNDDDYQWPDANRVVVPPGAGAEPAAPGSEEISVDGQPVIVEGEGGETLETTRSLTGTEEMVAAVNVPSVDGEPVIQPVEGDGGETNRESDDDWVMLPNMTAEFTTILQLSGGYLNCNALCILMCMPLSNSGHY